MNKLLIFISLLLIAIDSNGQNDSVIFKNYFSFNISELLLTDLRLNYEHQVSPKSSYEICAGFKLPLLNYSPDGNGLHGSDYINAYVYYGYNVSLGYNYLLNKRLNDNLSYLSGSLMYYNKYRKNFITVGGEDSNYGYELCSAHQDIFEFKLLFKQKIQNSNKRGKTSNSFVEWYIGPGIYHKDFEKTKYGFAGGSYPHPPVSSIQFNYFDNPKFDKFDRTFVRLCLGIKYGFGWKRFSKVN